MSNIFKDNEFLTFAFKVIVVHSATYFFFGLLMSNIFDYASIFQQEVIRDSSFGAKMLYINKLG